MEEKVVRVLISYLRCITSNIFEQTLSVSVAATSNLRKFLTAGPWGVGTGYGRGKPQ